MRLVITLLIALGFAHSALAQDLRDKFGTRSQDAALALKQSMDLIETQPKAALAEARKAIKLDPNFDLAMFYVANASERLGDMDGCIEAYRKTVEMGERQVPSNITCMAAINLALTLSKLDREDEAWPWFTRAILLDPADKHQQSWMAYRNMAICLRNRGRSAEAAMAAIIARQYNKQQVAPAMIEEFAKAAGDSEGGPILSLTPRNKNKDLAKPIAGRTLTPLAITGIDGAVLAIVQDPERDRVLAAVKGRTDLLAIDAKGTVTLLPVEREPLTVAVAGGQVFVSTANPSQILRIDPASGKTLASWKISGSTAQIAPAPAQNLIYYAADETVFRLDLLNGQSASTDMPATGVTTDPLQESVFAFERPARQGGGTSTYIIDGRPVVIMDTNTDWLQSTMYRYRIAQGKLLMAAFRINSAATASRIVVSPCGRWVAVVGGGGWRPNAKDIPAGYGVAVMPVDDASRIQGFFTTDAYPLGAAFNHLTDEILVIREQDAGLYSLGDPKNRLTLAKGAFNGISAWSPDGSTVYLAGKDKGILAFQATLPANTQIKKTEWLASLRQASKGAGVPDAPSAPGQAPQPTAKSLPIPELATFTGKTTKPIVLTAISTAISKGSTTRPPSWDEIPDYFRTPTEKSELRDLYFDVGSPEKRGMAIFKVRKQLEQGPHVVRSLILAYGLAATGDADDARAHAQSVIRRDMGKSGATQVALKIIAHLNDEAGDSLSAAYCWAIALRLDRADPEFAKAKAAFAKAGLEKEAAPLFAEAAAGVAALRILPELRTPDERPEMNARDLYRQVAPSVVQITVGKDSGSGVCVGAGDLVLTNHHVVSGNGVIRVNAFTIDQSGLKRAFTCDATRIFEDRDTDLAVLRLVKPPAQLTPVDVASSDPESGTRIYAIGSPGLGGQTLDQSISDGILSSKSREINSRKYLQHTAPINPGNSGGPLFDARGQLVGINTLKARLEGVGFSIPVSVIRQKFDRP